MQRKGKLQTKRPANKDTSETLRRVETRKGILAYYGSGIWQGDLRAMRKDRVLTKRPDTN
jgi:hypothetical protein